MKTMALFSCLLFLGFQTIHAQLANTKWRGESNMKNSFKVVLAFEQDTAKAFMMPDSILFVSMTYKVNNNQLTLWKAGGNIPCDPQMPGLYGFEIKNDILSLKLIKDSCIARSTSLKDASYERIP